MSLYAVIVYEYPRYEREIKSICTDEELAIEIAREFCVPESMVSATVVEYTSNVRVEDPAEHRLSRSVWSSWRDE